MPEVHENAAKVCLERGALGIGEDHTKPEGRRLAIDLIESGLVTHLFVELAQEHYGPSLASAEARRDAGENFDEVRAAAPNGSLHVCAIQLSQVIATALVANVPVHLADDYIMARMRKADFPRRHKQIRTTFLAVTGQPVANAEGADSVGCLFLWGGEHFEGDEALDKKYILGLPFIMKG